MIRAANVTILFTDIVGSTQLIDRLGDRAGEQLMRRHFAMLRQAISAADGHEVKTLGDGIMAIFRRPVDGLRCATTMQHGLARQNAGAAIGVSMRIGVHCGPVFRMGGDYYGIPVIVAKRLCDHGSGGQIIASEAVRAHCGDTHTWDDLGIQHFKGMSDGVAALELLWQARSSGAPVAS